MSFLVEYFFMTKKRAFVAGIGDDHGFGWAIAKKLFEHGYEILIGTWAPVVGIFTQSWRLGKFDASRSCTDGRLFEYAKLYPMDAAFDRPEDVPQEIKTNKRYADLSGYTLSEVAEAVKNDYGQIDVLIHCLANAPEVKKPLLETSRAGYLAAMSASAYSFVSLLSHFGPLMKRGGSALTLTYMASEKVIPKYGGGMSSAKAALESDTQLLAFEAGRKWGLRVNAISAGPLPSRAAKAIGMIEEMIEYSEKYAPLQQEFQAEHVAEAALFLASPKAAAITAEVLHVDNGLHAMGMAYDPTSQQGTPS